MPPPLHETLAFSSDRAGDFDIYTMNADGTHVARLTNDGAPERDPAWSPDGSKIAYVRLASINDWFGEIYVMNADGSDKRLLTQRGGSPAWSPDGKRIAFHRFFSDESLRFEPPDDPPQASSLWVINSDGSDERMITKNGGDPSWTRDGKYLVYGGFNTAVINVYKVAVGENATGDVVFADPLFACEPEVAPDGDRVAYVASLPTKLNVGEMSERQGEVVTTSGLNEWEYAPSWSSDGGSIAFERSDGADPHYSTYLGGMGHASGRSRIVIVDADGSGESTIASGDYSDADPAFAPRGP
jgi:Tol biopolymer transport system component